MAGVSDELALGLDRAIERLERSVEATGEPRELVASVLLEAVRRVGVVDHGLGLTREAPHGR